MLRIRDIRRPAPRCAPRRARRSSCDAARPDELADAAARARRRRAPARRTARAAAAARLPWRPCGGPRRAASRGPARRPATRGTSTGFASSSRSSTCCLTRERTFSVELAAHVVGRPRCAAASMPPSTHAVFAAELVVELRQVLLLDDALHLTSNCATRPGQVLVVVVVGVAHVDAGALAGAHARDARSRNPLSIRPPPSSTLTSSPLLPSKALPSIVPGEIHA